MPTKASPATRKATSKGSNLRLKEGFNLWGMAKYVSFLT